MKLRLIASITLAATLYYSCKNDWSAPAQGTNVMILRIDLPGVRSRASTEAPITSITVEGLEKVDIYLYDKASGIIYTVINLNPSQLEELTSNTGLHLGSLHPNIDAIAVICNNTEAKGLNVDINTQISTLFAKPINISLEQDFDNVTYFGKDEDIVQTSTPEGGSDDIDYFNASIIVAPLVARVEVSNITCTDKGGLWESLYLHSVYVDNVYSSGINLDYLDSPPSNPITITASAEEAQGLSHYWWLEVLEEANLNVDIGQTPWSPGYGNLGEIGVFAFHVFDNGSVPTLGLQVNATAIGSPNADIDKFVRFKAYANPSGNISSFESGHIYKIRPIFNEDRVLSYEYDPGEISLSITIQEWTIHDDIIATPQRL